MMFSCACGCRRRYKSATRSLSPTALAASAASASVNDRNNPDALSNSDGPNHSSTSRASRRRPEAQHAAARPAWASAMSGYVSTTPAAPAQPRRFRPGIEQIAVLNYLVLIGDRSIEVVSIRWALSISCAASANRPFAVAWPASITATCQRYFGYRSAAARAVHSRSSA